MIEAAVARIFSPSHVAISVGAEKGVKEGMVFVIYALGEVILDPNTHQSLGQLEIIKGRVKVFYVQEKMCQAETLTRKITEVIDPLALLGQPLAKHEVTRTVQYELKVVNPQPLAVDLTVHVGDLARSVE